jgi:hypothetical protein
MNKNFNLFTIGMMCFMSNWVSAQAPIFTDAYATGVTFSGFGGSVNDVTVDNTTFQSGTSSLKVVVPAAGYTGGAFVAATAQNLSTYNAVSFWIKGSAAKTLNVSGLGNNSNTTVYQAEMANVAVTTTWTKVIIPIPVPAKLTAETGLFHFAEGADEGAYTIWLDNIQYENIGGGAIGTATAAMATETINKNIGDAFSPNGLTCTFPVNGVSKTLTPSKAYFTYTSSTPAVATVSALGVGSALATGTTNITAALGAVAATGTLTVNVAAVAGPATAAPTPTRAAANVISLFSGAYTDLAGTDWTPNWGQTTVVTEVQIAGNATKKLSNLNYQGAQFATPVNVTSMTHLHIDIWTPNCTSFKLSLINIPPLTQTEQAFIITPTLSGWNSIEIPLTAYNTINRAGIGQFKFEGVPAGCVVYFDNVYFYNTPLGVPAVAAPTPTALAANVMSLFSGAYTDIAGTDWFPNWGQTTVVTEIQIAGNATKKYANLNYQGVQFANALNVTTMTHLHLDLWTPDCTSFKVSLISAGPVEQAVTLTPTLAGWNSFDIPLASYTTPNKAAIIQLKLEGTPAGSTVYLDNIYFFKPGVPLTAAPTPTALPANVMSLFSGAYTDIANTDWFPNWGQTTVVTDIQIAGNATKKYANLNYQGVQLGAPINVTTMNFLHLDLWTPDCTSFKVSLISAGPVEQAVTLTPTLAGWNSFDIPLTSYTTPNKAAVTQLKLEGTPAGSTVYLDNIYFYKTPAADPSQAVFLDNYATGVTFVGFGGSVNDVTVDNTTFQSGTSSLKVVVPATGWTGGALAAATNQNLSTYNAISFWVKASGAKTLNVTGLGNNATPTGAVYQAEMLNVPVTTTWTKVIIPIPVPAKLNAETGLFHFAEGSDEGAYTIWFDNIQYEAISGGVIGTPTAAMTTETISKNVGDAFSPNGLTSSFPVNGVAKTVIPSKAYFTYASSTPAVATVSALGAGSALSAGTTNITAMLGAVAATGTLTVNVAAAVAVPMIAAPTPTRPAASVISLFSGAYTDVAATDWFPNWGQTTVVTEIQIVGNATKKYSNFNYQGVQFAAPINASTMNYLHVDMWTPNCTSFKVSLVNIPPLTQTEQAVTLTPTLSGWNSFDIPFTSYNLINKTGIGQLKLEGTPAGSVVYLDNLFFFKTGVGTNDLKHSTDLFTVNPTLANDFVNINLNDNVKGSTQITFTTLTGQKVYEESLNADNLTKVKAISTQNLASGMYIIGVRVGDSFQTQKIVVSH